MQNLKKLNRKRYEKSGAFTNFFHIPLLTDDGQLWSIWDFELVQNMIWYCCSCLLLYRGPFSWRGNFFQAHYHFWKCWKLAVEAMQKQEKWRFKQIFTRSDPCPFLAEYHSFLLQFQEFLFPFCFCSSSSSSFHSFRCPQFSLHFSIFYSFILTDKIK